MRDPKKAQIFQEILATIPEFIDGQNRYSFIKRILAGYATSTALHRSMLNIDWQGSPNTVAYEVSRYFEGHEVEPGISVYTIILRAVLPLAEPEVRAKIAEF
jgi:hypothetical protein